MTWLEMCVAVDQETAEPVAEILSRYGYNGGVAFELAWTPTEEGEVGRDESGLVDVPCPCSHDAEFPVILHTYVPLDDQAEEVRQQVEVALWHLRQIRPMGPLRVRVLEEEDWAQSWKKHYTIQHIGERTVIVPSWLDYAPRPGDVVLHLDPGMAFGTGLHPTTRLCLHLLERSVRPGARVLDVGSGSGVLSIAAAKLGAASVLALDLDHTAVAVTSENVTRNGVHDTVRVRQGSIGDGSAQESETAPSGFDVVVANLIASVLIDLSHDLAAALSAGGVLISSGIILSREDEVALALAAAGLDLEQHCREDEWVALVHRRRSR
ncbi:MAG: 50S ribosomal protein L11 methyltransferase [Chloroflexaceae bacterium]|nr:50S ribosomal protein L11 methyltransferase [Chloroflexaceae bacterium]